tara:strand:+ start:477 stop:956 length:480 start_codon:yes stop_codon:yes gene_type:complete
MSRATIFWLIALAGMVVMTVTVSLKVNRVNAQIEAVADRKATVQDRIDLLDASYALLTSSERLTPLADRHLDLEEVRGDQLIPFDKLPIQIPLPTARRPEPQPDPPARREAARPVPPVPTFPPLAGRPPSQGGRPPWLEAQGRSALQPVTLSPQRRRPQ